MITLKDNFTREDTNQIKGIAILFVIFNHLFYTPKGLYTDIYIGNIDLIYYISHVGRVSIGMFVFFSGYGLFQSQKKRKVGLKSFYLKSYTKLYFNYWFIWLLFVPIFFLFFNNSLSLVYKDHIFIRMIINLLGLQDIFNFFGVNPTWWFMTCIILLYFLYPYLKVLLDKFDWRIPFFLFIFSLFSINISFLGITPYQPIKDLLFTFVLGMFCAKQNIFVRINNKINKKWIFILLLVLLLVLSIYLSILLTTKSHIVTDGIITILIAQILFLFKSNSKILAFIGRHSFNIFLFHTFIYEYFLKSFIYSFKNPIIIFVVLVFICLIISVVIEWIKKYIGFYKLQEKIINIHIKKDLFF